jgi:glycosyltransferase involved in cell wall biosynthesis
MSRLRIASIIWRDAIGGAERSLTDLAAALDRRKFDMIFYYLSGEPGYFANQIKQLGFNVEFLKWDNGRDISGRINLIKRLKQYSPHVIHDHILPPLTRPLIKMFLRCPIINTEHGKALQRSLGIGKKWRNKLEKFDFLFCDYIAANSMASAEALKAAFHLSGSKIGVVHLGINLKQFKPVFKKQPLKHLLRIGYVGRINKLKGVDYLPFVARNLIDQHNIRFKIFIAGDGPERKNIEQLCKNMGVDEYFSFLGWLKDVNNFLEKIDILLVPSRFESLGLTTIEALAMNVPVVAFDIQGLKEILSDCLSGKLIKFGDTKSMAEAVNSFYKNHVNISIDGRKFVEERFSNNRMAREYESIYITLIENS